MKRAAGLFGVILLLSSFWLATRSVRQREPARTGPPPVRSDAAPRGGIGPRSSTPSNAVTAWRDPSAVTDDQLRSATRVELGTYYDDPGSIPFDDIEPLIGWVDGTATDDDFGRAVASCRYEYERRAASHPCEWTQTIEVLQRDGESVVVGVDPELEGPARKECAGFIKCMQNAWKGRRAPAMLEGDGVYRVEAPARLPRFGEDFADLSDEEYADAYAAEMQRKETLLDARAGYVDEAKASGEWDQWSQGRRDSFLHNQAQSAARLVDCQMMLARIRG